MEIIKGDFGKKKDEVKQPIVAQIMEALAVLNADDKSTGNFILITQLDESEDSYNIMTGYDDMETNYILDVCKATILDIL